MFEDQSLPDADDQVSVSADSWYLIRPMANSGHSRPREYAVSSVTA